MFSMCDKFAIVFLLIRKNNVSGNEDSKKLSVLLEIHLVQSTKWISELKESTVMQVIFSISIKSIFVSESRINFFCNIRCLVFSFRFNAI